MNISFHFEYTKNAHENHTRFFSKLILFFFVKIVPKIKIYAAEGSASLSGGNLVDGLPPVLGRQCAQC